MRYARRAVVAQALVGLMVLLCAGTASAGGRTLVEPLNQYVVTGKVDTDALARAGFDMQEASVTGKKGKFFIVATPSQASELRKTGATVTTPFGAARSFEQPPPPPLSQPTHGYDVFRPWSLKPAPCPGTCATPLLNLKTIYHQLAQANSDVVKEEVIGKSVLGQPIMAYKVTNDARHERDGSRAATLYNSTQHAREWIATEVERRLFKYVLDHKGDSDIKQLLRDRELWFVPVVNVDGYDYTFVEKGSRLWRKNLRDVNGGGFSQDIDGVDPNRNWPTNWNYDLEGASADSSTETYHGSGPASEPEVQAMRNLERRIRFKFSIDYHSFAKLILYPEGWQVETPASDWPLMTALSGDDDHPAIEGFDPDVSAELYTTNGDVTDDAWRAFGTQAFTVELSGGSGPDVGGTVNGPDAFSPGGFVFQDSDADIQAEFEKNLAFALDLAKSTDDPDEPDSHLGNTAPDFVPKTFATSYGDPQIVEVDAKKALGNVRVNWQVNGGSVHSASTAEFKGGARNYGDPGTYYHNLRGKIVGTEVDDSVKVWFSSGHGKSASFTYTAKNESKNKVLLMGAEDYTGPSILPGSTPYNGTPRYLATYQQALRVAGIGFDTYDVDAQSRTAPTNLGVLSHYKAVVWFTGDDLYVREPGQPGGTGNSKLLDDEIVNVRDFMNEGGKALISGRGALQGGWDQFLYNPLGTPPFCKSNQTQGNGDADDPVGQNANCVVISNDFQQYWLGAYLPIGLAGSLAGPDPDAVAGKELQEIDTFGSLTFGLNGPDSAQNQGHLYSFLTTPSILKADTYPQFASAQAIKTTSPPAFDPPAGSWYAYSQQASSAYKRLSRTVDLTGKTSGSLSFKVSYDTEPGFDYVFVEAHTVGHEDWTTLADTNGHTSQDTGAGCPDDDPFWLLENPFLTHYITRTATGDPDNPFECTPTGTSGAWNAATGNSAGFQDWNVDLTAYAGKQVEVSITHVTDPAVLGLGVFVDDTKVAADGATVAETSFEDDLGGWSVAGPPADHGNNANDWIRTQSVGFLDGPGVATDHSVYWGFGLEGVNGAGNRATLIKDALGHFGIS
jgi:Zinc carboxypeptidase/Immune inhibitor A peptidase M6